MAAKKATAAKPITVTAISGDEELFQRRKVVEAIDYNRKHGWQVETVNWLDPNALSTAMTRNAFFTGGTDKILVVIRIPKKAKTPDGKKRDKDELDALNGECLDLLNEHLENGDGDVVLLLDVEGNPPGNTKLGKFSLALEKQHKNYPKPKDYKAPEMAVEFCISEAKGRGRVLSETLATHLVEIIGTDLGILSFEMLKICALAESFDAKEITRDHVQGGCAPVVETSIFSITEALRKKNPALLARALIRVKKTFPGSSKAATIPTARIIQSNVMTWLSVADLLAAGMDADGIANRLSTPGAKPLHPYVVKTQIIPGVSRWKVKDLERLVAGLAAAERAVFSGQLDPWTILSARLLEACG